VSGVPRRLALALLLTARCAGAPAPFELVDATRFAPSLGVEMRYAGPDNFVGAPVDGYEAPRCLLSEPAARALGRVDAALRPEGLGLLVYDCYRPQRAVDHFVRWAAQPGDASTRARWYPAVPKDELFARGYIARRSSHTRGSTVDVTLARLEPDGARRALDLGTPFDFFDPRAHTDSEAVPPEARRLRRRLRAAMDAAGFENLPQEWWHYTLRDEPYPDTYADVPVR
jgi:D-alanyl-D-alanine dipeptidase